MGDIIQTPIIGEVEQSFLDYSLSVITDRAIPSAEDGLKPVARRILWDMFDKGYHNNKKFVKCAQPVGDTMGRFHPHGDASIYGALVWLSQPWNMRYPLISFHGNNGSRDGYEAAAYRYTECKLSKAGEEMLADIKKDTVDWQLAYTDVEEEPVYLPGRIPNLIVNGTSGIAVAMACSFAPHNLNEVMDAAIYVTQNPNCDIKEILNYISGPDFPTGGLIINKDELPAAYLTGKGRARIRGEYKIESDKRGDSIVFTSIPYKVSKEDLVKDIDKLCEEGKLEGVTTIRDESNKDGVRFVIELAKGVSTEPIIAKLFKLTRLEDTYSFNQVALVEKKPQLLNIKQLLEIYIAHQKDVLLRKTKYEANKVEPSSGTTLWTSTYNSSAETTASWGPYKLESFQSGKQYVLVRNENWYGYNMEQYEGQYQTDRIVCDNVAEWNAAWLKFLAGEIDGIGIDVTVADDYKGSDRAYFTPDDFVASLQLQV